MKSHGNCEFCKILAKYVVRHHFNGEPLTVTERSLIEQNSNLIRIGRLTDTWKSPQ